MKTSTSPQRPLRPRGLLATACGLILLLLLGSGMFVNNASAAIAVVDQATAASSYDFSGLAGNQTTTDSITVTAPSVNSTLVVMVGWRANGGTAVADNWTFTYNGVPLTKAVSEASLTGTQVGSTIYYLNNPPQGTHNLVGTITPDDLLRCQAVISWVTLGGVDTTAALVTGVDNAGGTGTPFTSSATGVVVPKAGCFAVENLNLRGTLDETPQTFTFSANSGAATGNQVTYGVIPTANPFCHSGAGYVPNLTAGTYNLSVTAPNSTDARYGMAAVVFSPAPALVVSGSLLIDLNYQRGIQTEVVGAETRTTNWSNFGTLGGQFVQASMSPYNAYAIGGGGYPAPYLATNGAYITPNAPGGRCLIASFATPSQLQGASTYSIETWLWKNNTATDQRGVFAWTENTPASGDAGKFCAGDPAALHNNGKDLTWNALYPSSGAWHHTVLTYDGTTEILYLDGVAINSGAKTLNVSAATYYPILFSGLISSTPAQTSFSFNGAIGAMRVHSGPLTASAVSNNYALGMNALVGSSYTISGTIACNDAADAAGAVVKLLSGASVVGSMTVPSGGAYSFAVLPGAYTISASKNTYAPTSSAPISVTGGNVIQNLTLTKLPISTVSGTVHDGATGIAGVSVTATYSGGSASATSAGDGTYSLQVPATLLVTLSATNIPVSEVLVSVPAPFTVPDANPVTGKDVVLGPNPDYDTDLILSARSSVLPPAAAWPVAYPAGITLNRSGSPGIISIGGVQWEVNHAASADKYILPNTLVPNPYPINGGSIVTVVRPTRLAGSQPWFSIVDIQYDQMVLGMDNPSGRVIVKRKGQQYMASAATAIPDGQRTVLSLVVNLDGTFNVWANGTLIMNNTNTADMSVLSGGLPNSAIGGNAYDGWPIFNGNIGDFYVYKVALTDTKRVALEASLMNKFITNATQTFNITSSAGANGTISPLGTNAVLQGLNQTYTMTPNSGYIVTNVLVDGVQQVGLVGAAATYTFTNVSAAHTIAASFVTVPPQTITASVTGSGGTISPSGPVSVPGGLNQTFVMLPSSGYAVSNVVVDGVSKGEIYSYTFTAVLVPHTISVTFRSLNLPVPHAEQIIMSEVADVLPANNAPITNNWPTYVPATGKLQPQGGNPNPAISQQGIGELGVTALVGTNTWAYLFGYGDTGQNSCTGFRYTNDVSNGNYTTPIACSGATIMAVVAPNQTGVGDAWDAICSVFYNRLSLNCFNGGGNVGKVQVCINGNFYLSTATLAQYSPNVLSLVVDALGNFTVYDNGQVFFSGTGPALTSLVPGVPGTYADYIEIGRNGVDGWSGFDGNVGDVFLYKTNLSSADRKQLENALMTKYAIPLPPTYNWAGANNANWNVPANWDNALPTAGSTAVLSDPTAGAAITVSDTEYLKGIEFNNNVPNTVINGAGSLFFGNDAGGSMGTITADAGSHTINAQLQAFNGVSVTGPGTVTVTSPNNTLVAQDGGTGQALYVNGGTLNISGGTTTCEGAPNNSGNGQVNVDNGGTLNLTGAAVLATGQSELNTIMFIGEVRTGTVNLSGTSSWTDPNCQILAIGNQGTNGVGLLTITNSATLSLPAAWIWLNPGWGGGMTGKVVQNGGTVTTINVSSGWNGPGGPTVLMGGAGSDGGAAEYDLNGGTLQTANIYNVVSVNGILVPPTVGTAVFKFNGGVLRAAESDNHTDASVVAEGSTNLMGNLTHAFVGLGGAKINPAGFNAGISQALEHDPSVVGMDGGLTVNDTVGGGVLTLYKASTYSGPTAVQAGTLACATVSSLAPSNTLSIASGALVNLAYTGNQNVTNLTINGVSQALGVYGGTGSGAANINAAFTAGPGTVTVVPATLPPPPAPVLLASNYSHPGGVPTFAVNNTVAGHTYTLVYKNNLTDVGWTPLAGTGTAPGNGGTISLSDPTVVGSLPAKRFYKIQAN